MNMHWVPFLFCFYRFSFSGWPIASGEKAVSTEEIHSGKLHEKPLED
jgi:hypothetical protein